MSAEPNQSMEDQLRTCAERRRLEAPAFELDGAARRRLQEEVRRVYRAEAAPSTGAISGWFWARLGLVGAATAVALFLSVQLLDRQQPRFLSQEAEPSFELAAVNESAESKAQDELKEPMPGTTMPDSSLSAQSLSLPDESQRADPSPEVDRARTRSDEGAMPRVARSVAPPAPTAEPRAQKREIALGQQFQQVQQYRRNPNSPAPPRVLQSFQWIREGDGVKVIDEDGSVYTGALGAGVDPTTGDRYAVSAALSQAERGTDPPAQLRRMAVNGAEVGERFTVTGINRTLNVPVKFEGVLIPQPALAQTITNTVRSDPSVVGPVAAQIQGQALVGASTRLGIVADARAE